MGKRHRSNIADPQLYFVTTTLKDWQPLFSTAQLRDYIEQKLFSLIPDYADALMGYVIMPSHLHLLIGCTKGGDQFSKFIGTFKSLTARKYFRQNGSIWMQRFDDLRITTEKQLWIKLNYIHDNPVRKGFAKRAVDWKWSSAKYWASDQEGTPLTKDWKWMEKVSGEGA